MISVAHLGKDIEAGDTVICVNSDFPVGSSPVRIRAGEKYVLAYKYCAFSRTVKIYDDSGIIRTLFTERFVYDNGKKNPFDSNYDKNGSWGLF